MTIRVDIDDRGLVQSQTNEEGKVKFRIYGEEVALSGSNGGGGGGNDSDVGKTWSGMYNPQLTSQNDITVNMIRSGFIFFRTVDDFGEYHTIHGGFTFTNATEGPLPVSVEIALQGGLGYDSIESGYMIANVSTSDGYKSIDSIFNVNDNSVFIQTENVTEDAVGTIQFTICYYVEYAV